MNSIIKMPEFCADSLIIEGIITFIAWDKKKPGRRSLRIHAMIKGTDKDPAQNAFPKWVLGYLYYINRMAVPQSILSFWLALAFLSEISTLFELPQRAIKTPLSASS